MDHFITVDHLPDGFSIPNDLKEKLEYEPEARRLVHHGFMSKEEYDRLVASTDDWAFIRQLEQLFLACTFEDDSEPKGIRKLFRSFSWLGGPSSSGHA